MIYNLRCLARCLEYQIFALPSVVYSNQFEKKNVVEYNKCMADKISELVCLFVVVVALD